MHSDIPLVISDLTYKLIIVLYSEVNMFTKSEVHVDNFNKFVNYKTF